MGRAFGAEKGDWIAVMDSDDNMPLNCQPTMIRAKTITLIIAACLMVTVAVTVFTDSGRMAYSSSAAPYPEAWLQVKPGMTSDELRQLIGKPWADNRELKVLDRWLIHQNGIELHLDAWIENPNSADSRVERVVRWKQLLGAKFDNYVNPPWP